MNEWVYNARLAFPEWVDGEGADSGDTEASRRATVRRRTIRSKGCLSSKTALAMVFKLIEAVRKS